MPATTVLAAPARARPMPEAALAAAAHRLVAQPALWAALALPRPDARSARAAPWSAYWATLLDPSLEPAQARDVLAAARDAFGLAGERWGELLATAAGIETFYVDEGPLDPLDEWIARLEAALPPDDTPWPGAELQARVLACGAAILLRDPARPLLERWAGCADALLRRLPPGAARLKLATFLAQHHLWRGECHKSGLIVDALPGLQLTGLLPHEALMWYQTVATHARTAGEFERGLAAVDAALALPRGARRHDYSLHAYGASLALAAGDAARARRHVEGMRPVLDARLQADQTHYWHFSAGLAVLEGRPAQAVELARTALDNSGEIGGPYRRATHALSLGQALLAAGELVEAERRLDEAIAEAAGISAQLLACSAGLARAVALRGLGRPGDGLAQLRTALAQAARHDFRTLAGWWPPARVAELCAWALEHALEPAWVRRLVRARDLPGPDPAQARWPWALSLRAFGDFELAVRDEALARQGAKVAQRPLDLLRALLAHGGAPLPATTAMAWLWPEADAAARRKAFDVALLRLRRLLDDPRVLRLEGGRLSLAPEWVWSDVGALGALLHRIGAAHDADLAQLQRWGAQLLDVMRGPFLAGEEHDWVQAARSRYRQRFVVTVGQLAERIEPLDADAAARLYGRALDADPLAESLARRLMRLHARRGDRAEALRVLRTTCSMLQLAAGLGPARETLQLAADLGLPPR